VPQTDVYGELSRVRPAHQDRSRRAQRVALDAFEALLAERPLSRVTVQHVADRAGLSITSVYARFDGKDALVLALHERVIGDAIAQLDAQLGGERGLDAPVEEIVATLIDGALAFAHANAHVFRAVLVAGDDETNERAAAFIRTGSERIARVLAPRLPVSRAYATRAVAGRSEATLEDAREADVDFAWRSVVAVLQQMWALGGVDPSRFPLSRAQLSARLTRQFLAAIGHPGGP